MRATQPASSITTVSVLQLRLFASMPKHLISGKDGISHVSSCMGSYSYSLAELTFLRAGAINTIAAFPSKSYYSHSLYELTTLRD